MRRGPTASEGPANYQVGRASRIESFAPNTVTKVLAISGSLRARSSNTEVLRACALLAPAGVRVTIYDGLATLPHFNPDLDAEGAILPEAVESFRAEIRTADAVLISSPEYAHGVPGSLKNALDWLVSEPGIVFKPIGVLNISSRSEHAHASLLETLRTMSTHIVAEASPLLSLTRSMVSAESIAANPEIADRLRSALEALSAAAAVYRATNRDQGDGGPANLSPNPSGSSTLKSRSP